MLRVVYNFNRLSTFLPYGKLAVGHNIELHENCAVNDIVDVMLVNNLKPHIYITHKDDDAVSPLVIRAERKIIVEGNIDSITITSDSEIITLTKKGLVFGDDVPMLVLLDDERAEFYRKVYAVLAEVVEGQIKEFNHYH